MVILKWKVEEDVECDDFVGKLVWLLEFENDVEDDVVVVEDGEEEFVVNGNGNCYVVCLYEVLYFEGYDYVNGGECLVLVKFVKEYLFMFDLF